MNKDGVNNKKLYQNKQTFLIAAINDISGNIRFLDTKVSIVVATIGVILMAYVNCRGNIMRVYLETQNNCVLRIVFLFSVILYIASQSTTVFFAIRTISVRENNTLKYKSLWYIGDKTISFKEYYFEVQRINERDIIKNLTFELYKLNRINTIKMKYTKKTIVAFQWTCVSICAFGANIIMFYMLL